MEKEHYTRKDLINILNKLQDKFIDLRLTMSYNKCEESYVKCKSVVDEVIIDIGKVIK